MHIENLCNAKSLVFYNGEDTYPDEMEMRLSDSFTHSDGCMEFTARMININLGHNPELMEQCKVLEEYATFIQKIREFQNQGYDPEESIDLACAYCIEHNILKEFLLKNRNEVRALILTEYDEKKHMNQVRKEGIEEGYEKGLDKAQEQMLELMDRMIRDGRQNELPRLKEDKEFLQVVLKEYGLD